MPLALSHLLLRQESGITLPMGSILTQGALLSTIRQVARAFLKLQAPSQSLLRQMAPIGILESYAFLLAQGGPTVPRKTGTSLVRILKAAD